MKKPADELATLAERVRFAEQHLVVKTGDPFKITPERQWVIDEFWGPADGFKLWPVDKLALCDECRTEAGQVVHDWKPHRSQRPQHLALGCKGLELNPIIVTAISLPRQEGKTSNGMAYDLSTVFKQRNKNLFFVGGGSEQQTRRLFEENYVNAINANPKLKRACTIVGNTLTVPSTNSTLKLIPTSMASAMGSSLTHVRFDEARVIPAGVATAIYPSIFARNGMECPIPGHYHVEGLEQKRKTCPVCSKKVIPWFGRIIITSSAGVQTGGETDWFAELIERLREQPDQNAHLYERDDRQNPAISSMVVNAVDRVFGSLDSMKDYMEAEIHNVNRRAGEDVLTTNELARVLRPNIGKDEGSGRACVAVLDCSLSTDLTTLVIATSEPEEGEADWHRMLVSHMKFWDPSELPNGLINEKAVIEYLDKYMPLYPGLRVFAIDDRGLPWAAALTKYVKQNRPWGRKVIGLNEKKPDSIAAWTLLETRVRTETILMPDLPVIRKEFRGLKKVPLTNGAGFAVVDRDRKRSHKDVTETIALCCWLAHDESLRSRTSLVDVRRQTAGSVLSRVMRPRVRGLSIDSF